MKKHLLRLLDRIAPVRPPGVDRGYRRLLRWAALPVTDRRWAAPLAALALGFGIFAGVAIGPGASGSLAGGVPRMIELPGLSSDDGGEEGEAEAEPEAGAEAGGPAEAGGGGEIGGPSFEAGASAFESSFPEAESPVTEQPPPAEEETAEDEAGPEEPAQTIGGLVVHANPAAGSYTVVEAGGLLSAVHAAKLPTPGTKVSVPVRTLANGTFAEDGRRKQTGKRTSTSIAGIVTFVDADPVAPAYAVSKRGVSMLIRVRPDPSAAPVLPQLGAYATVSVEIERPLAGAGLPPAAAPVPSEAAPAPPAAPALAPAPPCAPDPAQPLTIPAPATILWQQKLEADGAPFASSDLAGIVTAICPQEAKLALSGDDLRQSGKDVVFTVPPSIDLTGLKAGDSVAVTATIEAGGSLTLTGLASDERVKGADDAAAAQGDLASQAPK